MARAVPVQVRFAAKDCLVFQTVFFLNCYNEHTENESSIAKTCKDDVLVLEKMSVILLYKGCASFPQVHFDELFTCWIFVLNKLKDFFVFPMGKNHIFLCHGIKKDFL